MTVKKYKNSNWYSDILHVFLLIYVLKRQILVPEGVCFDTPLHLYSLLKGSIFDL